MHHDLVVIGGGSAGLTAAIIAGRAGARVLLVDRERLGGDCTWTGCIPSKSLVHCARVAHQARGAERFGVGIADVEADAGAALRYVRGVAAGIGEHETPEAMAAHGVEVAFGAARFEDPHRLRIGEDRVVGFDRAVICTGSRAVWPAIDGLEGPGAFDHAGLFGLETVPKRLIVFGGGPIGAEMGQALARLDVDVTILEREPRILPRDDGELAELLAAALGEELTVVTGAEVARVTREGGGVQVVYRMDDADHVVSGDGILVAAGRASNVEGLGLDAAGVDVAGGRIVVDRRLRTSAKHIYAAGDCASPHHFTHVAETMARTAARNALFRGWSSYSHEPLSWVTFCDPELAQMGLTEADARERHGDGVQVFRHPYDKVDRALTESATHGLAKLVADQRGRLLGASILGPRAGEAITAVGLAMKSGMKAADVSDTVFAYPTMNRVVRQAADQYWGTRDPSPWLKRLITRFDGGSDET